MHGKFICEFATIAVDVAAVWSDTGFGRFTVNPVVDWFLIDFQWIEEADNIRTQFHALLCKCFVLQYDMKISMLLGHTRQYMIYTRGNSITGICQTDFTAIYGRQRTGQMRRKRGHCVCNVALCLRKLMYLHGCIGLA